MSAVRNPLQAGIVAGADDVDGKPFSMANPSSRTGFGGGAGAAPEAAGVLNMPTVDQYLIFVRRSCFALKPDAKLGCLQKCVKACCNCCTCLKKMLDTSWLRLPAYRNAIGNLDGPCSLLDIDSMDAKGTFQELNKADTQSEDALPRRTVKVHGLVRVNTLYRKLPKEGYYVPFADWSTHADRGEVLEMVRIFHLLGAACITFRRFFHENGGVIWPTQLPKSGGVTTAGGGGDLLSAAEEAVAAVAAMAVPAGPARPVSLIDRLPMVKTLKGFFAKGKGGGGGGGKGGGGGSMAFGKGLLGRFGLTVKAPGGGLSMLNLGGPKKKEAAVRGLEAASLSGQYVYRINGRPMSFKDVTDLMASNAAQFYYLLQNPDWRDRVQLRLQRGLLKKEDFVLQHDASAAKWDTPSRAAAISAMRALDIEVGGSSGASYSFTHFVVNYPDVLEFDPKRYTGEDLPERLENQFVDPEDLGSSTVGRIKPLPKEEKKEAGAAGAAGGKPAKGGAAGPAGPWSAGSQSSVGGGSWAGPAMPAPYTPAPASYGDPAGAGAYDAAGAYPPAYHPEAAVYPPTTASYPASY